MPAGGEAVKGGLTQRVDELDRSEVTAIEAGDWERLDGILQQQRALWRELITMAADAGSQESQEAIIALRALYDVRRRNHELIERQLAELRSVLASAHAGSDAADTYRQTARYAA